MHLISPLAAGIAGGANGQVVFLKRGTSDNATYYQDFEATQPRSGSASIALDANGSMVAYVNELVDVRVLDVNGVLIREFVAGDAAGAIEVISQSFTGTSYTDGSSGVSKPTTLQAVLDKVTTSFGTSDWKVLVGGSPMLLSLAVAGLAGLFYNVKTYGAIGDGVADDGAAIQATINAAAGNVFAGGVDGAVVFFPPGIYRTTTSLTVSAGVSLLGSGASASKIAFDNTSTLLTSGMSFAGTDTGSRYVQGLWFGSLAVNFTVPLTVVGGGGVAPCVDFQRCVFGGDTFTKGIGIVNQGSNASSVAVSRVNIQSCTFFISANAPAVTQSSSGRMTIVDSDMTLNAAVAYNTAFIAGKDGLHVRDCRFDASQATSGTPVYISYTPTTWGGCMFTGNLFKGNNTALPIALNNGALNQFDCYEAGNLFGDEGSLNVTPYAGSLGFYAPAGSFLAQCHGSRIGSVQVVASNGVTVSATAAFQDKTVITRNAAGAQTVNVASGRIGDRWTLQVVNASGGTLTITAGTGMILDGLVGTFAVSNGQSHSIDFVYWYTSGVAAAAWVQVSKGTDCG